LQHAGLATLPKRSQPTLMEQLQHNEEAKTIKQAKDDSSNEQS